jgi:uncharacterized membrane protein YagU involved in acid resistance
VNRYLAGAIAGTLATVPMTWVMATLFRRLPQDDQYPLPPREITNEVTRRAGRRQNLSEGQHQLLSLTAHFSYGSLTGALYPAALYPRSLSRAVRGMPLYQALFGAGYGVAIWAGSYMGWVPALRLLGPLTAQPAARRRLMICAHLVWGASTVLIGERLARQGQPPLRRSESVGVWE